MQLMITWLQLECTWNVFRICFMWLKQTQTTTPITSPGDSHLGNGPTDHIRRTPPWRIWRNETRPAGWLWRCLTFTSFDPHKLYSDGQALRSHPGPSLSQQQGAMRTEAHPEPPILSRVFAWRSIETPSPNQPPHISLVESVLLLSPFWGGEQRQDKVS